MKTDLQKEEPCIDPLPGMWDESDLCGGWADVTQQDAAEAVLGPEMQPALHEKNGGKA